MFRRANIMIVVGALIILLGAGNAWWVYQNYHSPLDTVYTSPEELDQNNHFIPLLQSLPDQTVSDVPPSKVEDPSGYFVPKSSIPAATKTDTVQPVIVGVVPDRLLIPSINLDAPIIPIHFINVVLNGQKYEQWIAPNKFAVGWHDSSALLGLPGNTVFNGHHNAYGKVFENLIKLNLGDVIIVYSGNEAFEYRVAAKMLLPERFQSIKVRMNNAHWILPSDDERLTLITCWPADSNTHRVVIVAFPVATNRPVILASATANSQTPTSTGVSSNWVKPTVQTGLKRGIWLTKSASPTTYSSVGDVINYTYDITNIGTESLEGPFTISDDKTSVSCPENSLIPGAKISCTASYRITQSDLDAGSVTNTAIASGSYLASNPANATVYALPQSGILLTIEADPISYTHAGQLIKYAYKILNGGNLTLTGSFTVSDDKVIVSCPSATLSPGETLICTASYAITQADLEAGSVTNHATASGNRLSSNQAQATIHAISNPGITLSKAAAPDSYSYVGQVVSYSYSIKNTGNKVLSGPFTVSDDKVTVSCPSGTLAPGEMLTCTASYAITQADLDAGSITNHATASGNGLTSNQAQVTVHAISNPGISLSKAAAPDSYSYVGQAISYSYSIKNTGNKVLSGPFTVSDDKVTVSCPSGTLAPGEMLTCTASYAITQADLDAGSVTNHATASGNGLTSNQAQTTIHAISNPGISLSKAAAPDSYSNVGQVISYSYSIKNTGNVTLTGPFSVSDDLLSVSCQTGSLAPEETLTCTASYAITQSDLDAGSVTNHASASANGVTSSQVQATVTAVQSPGLTIEKSASPLTFLNIGDVINYSYNVTNAGNVSVNNLAVTDDKVPVSCPVSYLAPSGSTTCTASYTITQADLDAGSVVNTAYAQGIYGNGMVVQSFAVQASVSIEVQPSP